MKKFIKSLIIYFSLIIILLFAIVTIIGITQSKSLKNSAEKPESIYLWGDSQLYQGVNVNRLSYSTKVEVFSLAQHGSGVYDLMVFCDQVPNGANIVLQIAKGAQKRKLSLDRSDSGLNLFAFKVLWKNNYSVSDLFYIFRKNIFTYPKFNRYSDSWPYHEKLRDNLHKELIFESYNNVPSYIFDKQNIILTALETLKNKNCKVLMIEIPFHPILEDLEKKSDLRKVYKLFEKTIFKEFNLSEIDSIKLEDEKNIFYDLTHYNEIGNKLLTDSLITRLNFIKSFDYVKFH